MTSVTEQRPQVQARIPDGPAKNPWLQSIEWYRDPVGFMNRNRERYGPIFSVKLGPLKRAAMIGDAASARTVMRGDASIFRMGDANGLMRPVVGDNSLLVLDGEDHLRHRRMLAPAFHGRRVEEMERMIGEIAAAELAALGPGGEIEMQPVFERIALAVIGSVVLGLERGQEREQRISAAFRSMMRRCDSPLTLMPQFRHPLGGLSPYGRLVGELRALDELLYEVIDERLAAPDSVAGDDALSMLVGLDRGDGRGLGRTALRDEVLTMLMAGFETTAGALAWAVERLVRNPEVTAELARSLASDDPDTYLNAVIRETLRHRPVVPVMVRKLAAPFEVGEFRFDRGWVLMVAISLIHSDPEIYPDPERFRPERFLEPPTEGMLWIPFGGGTRRCIGAPLAEQEMRAVLRELVRNFKIEAIDPGWAESPKRERFTLAPDHRTKVRISPLSSGIAAI